MAPADIYALLIPVHYRLSRKDISALVEAGDEEEFKHILDTDVYKRQVYNKMDKRKKEESLWKTLSTSLQK